MACNNGTYTNPSRIITPFSLLGGTPNTGGTWTYVSGPGTIPNNGNPIAVNGTISSGSNPSVDFNDACPGTYKLRYTIPASGGCPQATADIDVTVNDEPCVSITNSPQTLCQVCNAVQGLPVILATTVASSCVGGSAPSTTYQWQISTGGSFSNVAGATSSSYTVNSLSQTTTYRVIACNQAAPTCCTWDDIVLTLGSNICGGTPTNQTFCGTQTLNLNAYLSGQTTGGTWSFAPSNTGPTGAVTGIPGNGNGVTITVQPSTTTWVFRYTVTNGSCSTTVDLSITLSAVPSAGTGSTTTICN